MDVCAAITRIPSLFSSPGCAIRELSSITFLSAGNNLRQPAGRGLGVTGQVRALRREEEEEEEKLEGDQSLWGGRLQCP